METQLIVPFTKRPCHWQAATPLKPSAAQEGRCVDLPRHAALGQQDASPPPPSQRLLHQVKANEPSRGEPKRVPALDSPSLLCLRQEGAAGLALAFSCPGWQLSRVGAEQTRAKEAVSPPLCGFCVLKGDKKKQRNWGCPVHPGLPRGLCSSQNLPMSQ